MSTEISSKKEEEFIFKLVGKVAGKLNFPAYIIGGYVRDVIMGRVTNDIDFVCQGSGIELARAVAGELKPSPRVSVFKRFGTAMFKWKGLELEFVGARKESYSKDSRNPAVEEGSLRDDQLRRDFTINALAYSLNEDYGQVVDPFEGQQHIKDRMLITPLDPDKTFSDDPLRMMRAIRFATQLNFTIDPVCFKAIQDNADRISIISKERITTELNKILMSKVPSIGFKLLEKSGLLKLIFPEMQKLKGIEKRNGKAHKDNFYHTIEVVDNLSRNTDDLWLRWAAVLHDIAKPVTKRFDEELGWTFHGHEALGANWVPKIFKRLKLPLDHKMKYVQKLVRLHLRPISLTKENITDSAVRRLLFESGEDLDDLLLLCEADITSKNRERVIRYTANYKLVRERLVIIEENDKIRNWQPPVDGGLIMSTFGVGPSRAVGTIKKAIREAILDGDIANNKEAAFEFMIQQGVKLGLKVVEK